MYHKAEDIIMKNVFDLLKGDALKYFGIDKKIIAPAKTELNFIDINTNINDNVYLLEDNTFIHFEFQTTNKKDDIYRFMASDAVLAYKERKPVRTIVIYSADILNVNTSLNMGSIEYHVDTFYMVAFDGDRIYNDIRSKVNNNQSLTKHDLMSIVLLPIMKSSNDKLTRIKSSIELSRKITDDNARLQAQAMLYLFADKFINDTSQLVKVKELLNMTVIAEMMLKDKEIETKNEIAKKALREGATVTFVKKITELDESTIKRLQDELDNE